MLWSQSDLVKATAGDLIGDWRNDGIAGVSIDSRSIKSDELFVAVKAKRDGHNFINDAINLGSGFFQHGHTYLGHPIACAASLAVVNKLIKENFPEQVRKKGKYLQRNLEITLGQNEYIGDIRGRGLFKGIELVKNRDTKEPFPKNLNIAGNIKKKALDLGLICYPTQGTIDGNVGDHILIAPPFIINENEMNEISQKLKTTIESICN